MHIERVQVEEGFLDGLDLRLVPGLNVLIGERGTGKTSVIELIRFALDVRGYTSESTKRATDHARAILGTGAVTLTLDVNGNSVRVTRTAADAAPRANDSYPSPIIFSQSEIEAVGLHSTGRLRLLDSFLSERLKTSEQEGALVARAKSLTVEIQSVTRDLLGLDEKLKEIPAVDASLRELGRVDGIPDMQF